MSDCVAIKLHNTTDARVWAEEFVMLFPKCEEYEHTLVAWFANAIETGRMHANGDPS